MRALFAVTLLLACSAVPASGPRLIVLGIDGLDPDLLERFMQAGELPNFAAFVAEGDFVRLGTSVPPQSPVAWSSFITGLDPGGHGIFDFLALDRKTLVPYLSTSRVEPAAREPLAIGGWRVPLAAEETSLLRDGVPFWELLEAEGVETTLFRMPANYPPGRMRGRALAGMGTPDLRGTPGTFTFLTDDPAVEPGRVSGGEIRRLVFRDHATRVALTGPPNAFREGAPAATAELAIYVDPENPVAELRLGETRALLAPGEWSEWLPVRFELVPGLVSVSGMLRAYLQELRPHVRLYLSPTNIDPSEPAQPIAVPEDYAPELARHLGRFYTQEMPEDTKALSAGVFSPQEFIAQSELVLEERRRALALELERFRATPGSALLFFYVSSVDQRSHMLYRQMDASRPKDLAEAVRHVYREADAILGEVRDALDPDTELWVMSDHGFSPFRHQANLNRWLELNGYLALRDPELRDEAEWLEGLDWSRTRAFAIGLNSLYLNVLGRERFGSVAPNERATLAREIADALHEWRDPTTGAQVVSQALLREEAYHGPHVNEAPDVLVGYGRGYRASWATTTGRIPEPLLEANDREWSGDHCMDARVVPGVLLSQKPIRRRTPDLRDVTMSILDHFGVDAPTAMQGRGVF